MSRLNNMKPSQIHVTTPHSDYITNQPKKDIGAKNSIFSSRPYRNKGLLLAITPVTTLFLCLIGLFTTTGCSDPTAAGRFQSTPVTNIILHDLGVVDEGPEKFAGYRDPEPRDLQSGTQEYLIRSGDVITISIMDFFQTGVEWMAQKQVSETGRITLPELGPIIAAGRTELGLTDAIVSELTQQDILKEPTVSIVVVSPTGKVYTVSGAVGLTGRYQLTEPDLRIMAALAEAGGIPQSGADWAFIVRKVQLDDLAEGQDQAPKSDSDSWEPASSFPPVVAPKNEKNDVIEEKPTTTPGNEAEIAPDIDKDTDTDPKVDQPKEVVPDDPNKISPDDAIEELKDAISPMVLMVTASDAATSQDDSTQEKPVKKMKMEMVNGQWVPVSSESQGQVAPPANETPPIKKAPPFKVDSNVEKIPPIANTLPLDPPQVPGEPANRSFVDSTAELGHSQEVIRVNLKKLRNGDLNQNVVIRPGDDIFVPVNVTGVYYVMGQVNRPGPYALSERQTLKQVLAVVAGPTPMAHLGRCDVIRRIEGDVVREVTYRVNLAKLLEGTQPDIFIKPNDTINLGSHPTARWLAVIRQSFRSTYGFGFVYDRNLADKDFGH